MDSGLHEEGDWNEAHNACVTIAYRDACRELAQPTNFLTSSLTIFSIFNK